MHLAPGSRIGSHVVLSLIGEGGMGEVYRARDTTLDREVAIKRLPDALANDPERLARFEREAKALAALNHPNVAQIYAVESGTLVMELVPGEPLRGPLPLDTALDYARQIASALEAAHEKGIIHRDLKPGNVMVTPDGVVKVLDFGLAARDTTAVQADPNQSPTLTAPISAGMILGTAAYMAPEQASGKPVDKRADIFAFGVLLWEMLSGRRMFEGETISHVLAAVLTKEPDLTAVPPRVRHLLSRCLEKDPKKRLRDIGDAMSLVSREADQPVAATVSSRQRFWSLAGWITAGAVAAFAVIAWPRSAVETGNDSPVARFSIPRTLDLYGQTASAFALSPDGLKLAYYDQTDDGRYALLIRNVATGEVSEVTGANRVFGPRPDSLAWSTDSRQLFRAIQGGAMVIDVATGASRTVCDCRVVGATWNRDGAILVGAFGFGQGIRRVSAGEQTPVAVTTPNADLGEQDRWPVFLPDGRRFLFTRTTAGVDATYQGTLDSAEVRKIAEGSPRAIVTAPDGSHQLIGIDASGAWARPFDVDSLTVTGIAKTLVAGAASVSVSEAGVIATSTASTRPRTIPTWFDRSGNPLGTVGARGFFESVALSDDGRMLAVAESPLGTGGRHDIWAVDALTGVKKRLTFHDGNDSTPAWSPDGRRVIYSSIRGVARLFQRSTDGTGDEAPLFDHEGDVYPNDWSRVGDRVLYTQGQTMSSTNNDLWVVTVTGGVVGKPAPYLVAPGRQQQGRFSPDGRFVAFGSDQSGVFEIYVQPFPDASQGKWMVSTGGGTEPRWSRDGKELFYVSGQALMAVSVSLSPTFSYGTPVKLFDAPIPAGYTNESDLWQVAPDGKRFLFLPLAGPQPGPPLDVIVNWPALMKN
jgi:serine/threonine protein kinase/Tol biopolymer transport system component